METSGMNGITGLGERKVIKIIMEHLEKMPDIPFPYGDDVSAVQIDDGTLAVLKTDMLVGKTDIPSGMSLKQAARKAVVMNVSDFAAKGVRPLIALASLGLPKDLNEKDVEEIGLGLNWGAREYGAYIVGGDTNESSDLIINCSLLGFCKKSTLVKRGGARPGDIVAVTGLFGKTPAGLKILQECLSVHRRIEKALLDAVLMPKARLWEGLALAESKVLTASIDSSDGLAWSLSELSDASGVGFIIDDVPLAHEAKEFAEAYGLNPLDLALYGGEEYELVVTVKPQDWKKAKEVAEGVGAKLTKIGRATEGREILLKHDEEIKTVERKGWEHFKTL